MEGIRGGAAVIDPNVCVLFPDFTKYCYFLVVSSKEMP